MQPPFQIGPLRDEVPQQRFGQLLRFLGAASDLERRIPLLFVRLDLDYLRM